MGDEEGGLHPSKKRVAGRQISKDHPESDDDASEPEMGTFKKASEEVMATRRIVKVRRNQPAAAASSNPFAGICLVPPKETAPKATDPSPQAQAQGDVPSTEQQNLRETSIVSQENKEPEVKSVENNVEEKEANGAKLDNVAGLWSRNVDVVEGETTDVKTLPTKTTKNEQGEIPNEPKSETAGGDQEDAEKEAGETENVVEESEKEKPEDKAVPSGPFSSFKQLSSSQNAFTGFSGTGFSTSSFGFGSFAAGASTLGVSSGSLFGFNSENASQPVNGNSSSALLNSATDSAKGGQLTLQEVPVETGEENEKAVFTADATLYEYLDGGWKERGKGELKLNISVNDAGKARLVMRARGNYRLILNASLYPDMSLTSMEKKGVTFACINSAGEANDSLATVALKFKDSSFVEEFRRLVMMHKGKKSAAEMPVRADEQV